MTVYTKSPKSVPSSADLHPLLSDRWSTRAFDDAHELTDTQFTVLLEAARWAPSASNGQPWRFLVGKRGDATFDGIFNSLMGGNQPWAGNASAFIVMVAVTADEEGSPLHTALYDLGLAASQLTIQAHAEGLHVHQMGGFDRAQLKARFGLEDRFQPVTVIAVGEFDEELELPEPFNAREEAPRVRLPLDELILGDTNAN